MDLDLWNSKITGTQVAYNIVCKRKLWLFAHHIQTEKFSDYVALGKLISEYSFRRETHKEVLIGDAFKIDFIKIGDEIIVHEVKKSKKLEEAHIWQIKFYIYSLKKLGLNSKRGVIHYPKLMRKIEVEFEEKDKREIEKALEEIEDIKTLKYPPPIIDKPYCKKCAYHNFCYI